MTKIVALAGGVGGAKLADGLARIVSPEDLTIIVNTGDDFELFGLKISPDIDTVCYTISGLANPETGWGRRDETWNTLHALKELDAPTWFNLGDADLALHLERSRLEHEGLELSEITQQICKKLKIQQTILPMTDDQVSTIITTREYGDLAFQEYFVKYQFQPTMMGLKFDGVDWAHAPRKAVEKLEQADSIIICPSNPWVSILPILSVSEIKNIVAEKKAVAVSPIIGGNALKGPAAKMYREMGIVPSATEVARQYLPYLKGFVLDEVDAGEQENIEQWGIISMATNTIMTSNEDRVRLAKEVLEFSLKSHKGKAE
jgi:LPPG:FO 2-phospho-L-lactate transferase